MYEGQTTSTTTNGDHLRAVCGLDVEAVEERTLTLRFGPGVTASAPLRRTSADLRPVLLRPEAAREDDALYTLYPSIAPQEGADEMQRRGLTYVAMAVRAGTIGPEWARTLGHINSSAAHTSVGYPEVREVWQGRALLYLQKGIAPEVEDTAFMELGPGDKAVVAPGWASLIANIGDGPLVVGSWRAADLKTQQDALFALGGMAHFVLADKGAAPGFRFEPNTHYRSVAVPRRLSAHDITDFGLTRDEPMLTTFRRNPDFLRFMLRPQDYDHAWSRLYREE